MTEKSEKQLAIQKSVMDVMEKHIAIWQDVEEIRNKYDLFIRNIKKIDDDLAMTGTNLPPLKQKCNTARKVLVRHAFPIISVLDVYASDIRDDKLIKLLNSEDHKLEKMKPDALKKYCSRVIKSSSELLKPSDETNKKPPKHVISGYGLTAGHVDGLQKALDQFTKDQDLYRETRSKKKRSEVNLEKRIRDNNVLLKRKLDKMIPLFRDSHKAFHDAYIRARLTPKPAHTQTTSATRTTQGSS